MTDPLDASHTAPKFAAPNPGQIAHWYETHLGFLETKVYEEGGYAIARRGDLTIHFWKCEQRSVAENTACYTEIRSVEALDQLHAELSERSKKHGFFPGRVQSKPCDAKGHGMREFHVWDPAGNLIGFAARLENGR